MSELRQNLITRDWVIIATERAKRPYEFIQHQRQPEPVAAYREDCPFCAGNESVEAHEILRLSNDWHWQVRVVPNRYPALIPNGNRIRYVQGTYHCMPGVGYHEVVIEHPRHDSTIALMTVQDIASILQVYRQRYKELRSDRRIETIIIFKNHGIEAGTSLEHPHSQIAATLIVPTRLRYRIAEAVRYFDDMGECLICRTLEDELTSQERIIYESQQFVAFIPYAALSPFHTWIFPRRHASSFDSITDDEINDLALILKTVLIKLYRGLNNPDYNYVIQSVPTSVMNADYFHWYIAIIPRVSRVAGFEMGSGMYINTSLPEESAAFLRAIEVV